MQPRLAEPSSDWVEAEGDADDALRREIAGLLGVVPVETDELVRTTNATPGQVANVLLELDLAGRLRREPGGKVALLPE
jgi:DNA processing protein